MDARLFEILVVCPLCKGRSTTWKDKQELVCKADRLAYPIRDGIPVMLGRGARHERRGSRRAAQVRRSMAANFRIVVPARYASTRCRAKPLADIGGKPMIVRVLERVRSAGAERDLGRHRSRGRARRGAGWRAAPW